MTWEPYEPYTAPCSGGPEPGTAALAAALLDTWDIAWSLGIYNCRPPSVHSDGRAFDMALPMIDGRANPIGYQVIARVEAVSAQLGVQEAIFDRKRWSLNYPDGIYYGGVSPHFDHIHFSQTKAAAAALTYTEAIRLLATDDGGDDMPLSADDLDKIKDIVIAQTRGVVLGALSGLPNSTISADDIATARGQQPIDGVLGLLTPPGVTRFHIEGDPIPGAQYLNQGGSRVWLSGPDIAALRLHRVPIITVAATHWLAALPLLGPAPGGDE